jgi:uncharacterized membrane protein YgcG
MGDSALMRWLVFIFALAACTPPSSDQVYTPRGERIDIAYLIMEPLCLIFCTTTVSTTGTDSDVTGSGSATNSSSSSVTTGSMSSGGGNTFNGGQN